MSKYVTFKPNANTAALLARASQAGLIASALAVEAQAVALCPTDTGRLKQSITWKTSSHGGKSGLLAKPGYEEAIVGTGVEYAHWVEYGTGIKAEGGKGRQSAWVYFDQKKKQFFKTSGHKPQSFLRKGFDMVKPHIKYIYAYAYSRVLG